MRWNPGEVGGDPVGESEVPADLIAAVRVSCVVCGVSRAGPGRSVSGVGPGEGRARGGGPAQRFPGEGWAGEKL